MRGVKIGDMEDLVRGNFRKRFHLVFLALGTPGLDVGLLAHVNGGEGLSQEGSEVGDAFLFAPASFHAAKEAVKICFRVANDKKINVNFLDKAHTAEELAEGENVLILVL